VKGRPAAKGKVVALGITPMSAGLLGGKSPDACYSLDPATGRFRTSDHYAPRPHAWVEAFNKDAPADRWAGRAWDRLLPADKYDPLAARGPGFPHQLPPLDGGRYHATLATTPFAHELLWELARAVVEQEKLGQRPEAADLLCLGFAAAGDRWGPDSHEFADHLARADRLLADIHAYLTTTLGADNFALIVAGARGGPARRPNPAAFAPLNGVMADAFGPRDGGWVAGVDFPWLRLTTPDPAAAEFAGQWCENRPGMAAAYPRAQLAGPPLTDPVGRAAQLGFHPDRSGDVFLVPRPGPRPESHVAVLAVGAGVGMRVDRTRASALAATGLVRAALGLDSVKP
jgi:hypothetical protein